MIFKNNEKEYLYEFFQTKIEVLREMIKMVDDGCGLVGLNGLKGLFFY